MRERAGNIIVKSPRQCSKEERAAFVNVAVKGGEVDRGSIQRGTESAELLLWIDGDSGPIAVAALKNPLSSYRRGVFSKAGIPIDAAGFPLEFGYLYVEEAHQRNGYGPALIEKAVQHKKSEGIFATVRTDNDRMYKILPANGFALAGVDYTSERDPLRKLRLFIRPAS